MSNPTTFRVRLSVAVSAAIGALGAALLSAAVLVPLTNAAYADAEYARLDLVVGAVPIDDVEIVKLAGGSDHVLALAADGTVYSWGYNTSGQLGLGDTTIRTTAQKVTALSGRQIVDIAAGAYNSFFLDSDGTVHAVGQGTYGSLGQGNQAISLTIVTVPIPEPVASLAAYRNVAGAVTRSGNVWAWGENFNGAAGYTNGATFSSTPLKLNVEHVRQVSFGYHSGIAVTEDGRVYTWGRNTDGELGAGFSGAGTSAVEGSTGAHIVANGNQPGFYAIAPGAAAVGGVFPAVTGVRAVNAGFTTMSLILDDGRLYTWGREDSGELGNGGVANEVGPNRPTRIALNITNALRYLGTGFNNWGVLTEDGHIFMWGNPQSNGGNAEGSDAGTVLVAPTASTVLLGPYREALNVQREGTSNAVLAVSADGTIVSGVGSRQYGKLADGHTSPPATTSPAVWTKPNPAG
ncbi:hypothetical protein AB1K54_10365 [Microbacterium sp. BWT-B31]|uniref:RCC1 domain-containing protein n=1 Tax=Microbacterium sp. BWT-B31 TaxID=3232072 RepID=UPI00352759F6